MQGLDAMPPRYRRCLDSWAPLHPSWDIMVWDLGSLGWIENGWVLDIDNPTVQSDVSRIEVVRAYGGVYVDCDMECRKSIEPLVGERTAFASRRNSERVENAGFGAVAVHPWLESLVSIVHARRERISRVLDMDGPFNASLKLHPEVDVLPHYLLHVSTCENEEHLVPEAYVIHHRFSRWKLDDSRYALKFKEVVL